MAAKVLGKCDECGTGIDYFPDDPPPHLCSLCRKKLRDEGRLPQPAATEAQSARARIRKIPSYTYAVPVADFESLGLVSGTAVMGANLFRDIGAAITDIVGGRSGMYQASIAKGRDTALAEMVDEAVTLGASAVAGVSIDVESINNMFVVFARGTAVRERENQ